MLTVILIVAWALFFAPLVIVPLLPKVDARPRVIARRDAAEQVRALNDSRIEHAA